VPGQPSVREVEMGEHGQYLFVRRTVEIEAFMAVVERSVSARAVHKDWLEWDDDVWVGIALRLDQDISCAKAYTFLPIEQDSPLAADVHAPFFAKLARRDVNLGVPLNAHLMGQIAGHASNSCKSFGIMVIT
jgi:hypothetical protein